MRAPQEQKRRVDAFVVIRDAMRDKSTVALGRVVLSKRERVPILQPWGRGPSQDDAALPIRGPGRRGVFRRHPGRQDSQRHVGVRRAYPGRPCDGRGI
jgi:hypothetical protein